jgi:hypothetical protein
MHMGLLGCEVHTCIHTVLAQPTACGTTQAESKQLPVMLPPAFRQESRLRVWVGGQQSTSWSSSSHVLVPGLLRRKQHVNPGAG